MEHWFGLPLPEGVNAVRHWGARAILRLDRHVRPIKRKGRIVGRDYTTTTVIEMVPDRSQYRGSDIESPEAKAFFRWLDKTALPQLRKDADKRGLAPDDELMLMIDDGCYHLRANPRKSYGYLYIVAWEDADEPKTPEGWAEID
jgi:hypothetical protein